MCVLVSVCKYRNSKQVCETDKETFQKGKEKKRWREEQKAVNGQRAMMRL